MIAAEMTMERDTFPSGGKIPDGDVETRNSRRDWSALAGLQDQNLHFLCQDVKGFVGRGQPTADQSLADVHRQPCAMLSTDRRPIAPHLAPALMAIRVDDANEDARPVAERPERDLDRLRRHSESECLD